MIRKTGASEWTVYAESGRSMGSYSSRSQAGERLRQVEAAKAAKGSKGPDGGSGYRAMATRAGDPIAQQVYKQLFDDFDPSLLGWVLATGWSGPTTIPIDQFDFANRDNWRASHEPDKVGHFAEEITQGEGMKPVIAAKEPGRDKLVVVDGHHRLLAYEKSGQPVLAYVAYVPSRSGPWETIHAQQREDMGGQSQAAPTGPQALRAASLGGPRGRQQVRASSMGDPSQESDDSRKANKIDPWMAWARSRYAGPRGEAGQAKELEVPKVEQQTSYSCGPAALRAVLMGYGMQDVPEAKIGEMAGTSENGTTPEGLVQAAQALGLDAEIREGMTPDDLREVIQGGQFAIVALQAWANEEPPGGYGQSFEHGHYVLAVGVDGDQFLFEDPSLEGSDHKASLSEQELSERWHDTDGGRDRFGVAVVVSGGHLAPTSTEPSPATPMP